MSGIINNSNMNTTSNQPQQQLSPEQLLSKKLVISAQQPTINTSTIPQTFSQQQPQMLPHQKQFQSSSILPSTNMPTIVTANTNFTVPPYFQQQPPQEIQLQKTLMNMSLEPNPNNIQGQPIMKTVPTMDNTTDNTSNKNKTQGKVKWFSGRKGYGFITLNDGSGDVFVHHSQCYCQGYRSLADGEVVEFDVEVQSDGRRKAKNVTGPNGTYCVGGQPPAIHNTTDNDYNRSGSGSGSGSGGYQRTYRENNTYGDSSGGGYQPRSNTYGGRRGSSRGGRYDRRGFGNRFSGQQRNYNSYGGSGGSGGGGGGGGGYGSGGFYNNSSNSNYQIRSSNRRTIDNESGNTPLYGSGGNTNANTNAQSFQRIGGHFGGGSGGTGDVVSRNSAMMQFVPMPTANMSAMSTGMLAFDQANNPMMQQQQQPNIQTSPPVLGNVQQYSAVGHQQMQ